MSMYTIDINMFPSGAVLAGEFAEVGGQLRSYREPLQRAIQKVIAPAIQANFDAGGRPDSWEPISPDTERQRFDPSGPPLTDTRILRRVAAQLNAWTITTEAASMDKLPGAEYGFFHDTGTRIMPQRQFAIVEDSDLEKVDEVFVTWMMERFARIGF